MDSGISDNGAHMATAPKVSIKGSEGGGERRKGCGVLSSTTSKVKVVKDDAALHRNGVIIQGSPRVTSSIWQGKEG